MRVPIYDSPQVAPSGTPTPRVGIDTTGAFGEALNQGATQLAGGVADVVRVAKQHADVVANADALSSYQEGLTALLANHETGILNAQGKAAFDRADGYQKRIADLQQQALASLTNDQQKAMFSRQQRRLTQEAIRQVETHLGQQHTVIQEDALDNTERTGVAAVSTAPDPISVAIEHRARLEGQAKALGRDDDYVQMRLARFDQQVAAAALRPLVSKTDPTPADAARAAQLLDAPYAPGPDGKMQTVRQALGTSAPEFVAAVNTLTSRVSGDTNALSIVNTARRQNGSIDEAEVAKKVEALPQEQRTPALEQSLSKYISLERAAWTDRTSSAFSAALTAFQRNHSLDDIPADTEAWLRKNDPIGWGHLEETAANWTHKSQKSDSHLTGNFVALSTDMAENPYKYRAMPVEQFNALAAPYVAEQDFKELGRKFAEIKSKPEFELNLSGDSEKVVNGAFHDAFSIDPKLVDPTKWTTDQQAMWRTVHDYVQQKATDFTVKNKKRPDLEQLSKWAGEKLHKVAITGSGISLPSWLGGATLYRKLEPLVQAEYEHKPYSEDADSAPAATVQTSALPTARPPTTLDDSPSPAAGAPEDENAVGVPALARAVILQRFKAQGRQPPTEEQLRAVYAKAKAAGRFK